MLCHILLTLMLQLATVHHRPLPSQLLHFLLEMMFWNPSKMMCLHNCSTLCQNPGHEPTYPPFRKHCARGKILRNYFPRDCAKLSQSIARNNSWGIVLGAISQFCRCSPLSYCSCSMRASRNRFAQWPFCHCTKILLRIYFCLDCAKFA